MIASYGYNKSLMNKQDCQLARDLLLQLEEIADQPWSELNRLIKHHPKSDGGFFAKTELLKIYRQQAKKPKPQLIKHLLLKPIRTASGVSPVTVLTKPYPCPGHCLFCPNDLRMPKSYLAEEPGAQRAEKNYFDPYLQLMSRLTALSDMGHPTDKVELIILGGTWTAYPSAYRLWFIQQCFQALNDFGHQDQSDDIRQAYVSAMAKLDQPYMSSDAQENLAIQDHHSLSNQELSQDYNHLIQKYYLDPEKKAGISAWQQASWLDLEQSQQDNETAQARCVGLVLETRPDEINRRSVLELRRLGATKIQLGVQSLNDQVLKLNQRGHTVARTRQAIVLLRQAGFKIHLHWMANLYGSDVKQDQQDFLRLFADPDFRPDELKIYPCSLIETAPLMDYYRQGLWQPYTHQQLLEVMTFVLLHTPAYCRITRVVRDIPAQDIVSGNKKSNFRQIAQDELKAQGQTMQDVRSREIRRQQFDPQAVVFNQIDYQTSVGQESFLQFTVPVADGSQKLLAFLRLSLPKKAPFIDELAQQAIIREIHVYGQSLAIGKSSSGQAQHLGLGKKLIKQAQQLAQQAGYQGLAVISAVGTREYYRQRGFKDGQLYQSLALA